MQGDLETEALLAASDVLFLLSEGEPLPELADCLSGGHLLLYSRLHRCNETSA